MKIDQRVYGQHARALLHGAIGRFEDGKVYHVVVKECSKRSLDQNALSHAWYNEIAMQLQDRTVLEVKCESKLYCGVPILRAEEPEFCEVYDQLIKTRCTVEEKLKLMRLLPVTSIMTKDQLSQYLHAMQEHWQKAGVVLVFPDDMERLQFPEAARA